MRLEEFNLDRFLNAQEHSYDLALEELHRGRKRSHWIWFVFPQLRGLGTSAASYTYGLVSLAEARAYLAHHTLGQRLIEATYAVLNHRSKTADCIFGELDALKFRSCLTLFSLADPSKQVLTEALECFFDGELDAHTIKLLASH